jgi:hypothetical protein
MLSQQAVLGTPFACFTGTKVQTLTAVLVQKVQILTHAGTGIGAHIPLLGTTCFAFLVKKYKSTNTDADA